MNKLYPILLEHHLPIFVRQCLAVAVMSVCAVLQITLQALAGYPSYFPLLPGIFLSGLIFNRGTGILAAAIGVCLGAYLSYDGNIRIEYLATNGLFAITAAGTAVVAEFLRAEMKRVMSADKTKTLLLQEMVHRTKNNLAVLSAMIRLQARNANADVAAALEATARRIHVVAEVYDHLSLKQDLRLVAMRYFLTDIVEKVFLSLGPPGPVAFNVFCDDVQIANSQALAIGIVTNELVTNSLKYAFPDDRPGHITVRFSAADEIELSVTDNGIGFDGDRNSSGLGSRIIALLTEQLGGTLSYEKGQPGLCARLRAPSSPSRHLQ